MYSLYHSLLAQHHKQLTPIRCADSTVAQLHRYFEEVVLENNLSALVIESLPVSSSRSAREVARVKDLARVAQNTFLFLRPEDTLSRSDLNNARDNLNLAVLDQRDQDTNCERFVIIADARFAVLLASVPPNDGTGDQAGDLVVWSFEPDVVYSALEYLMARVTAEHPYAAQPFAQAVRASTPKATSLHLTLSVTTKLARLLQEQAERETAVNRIATAIRQSLDLDGVLQTAADEVGRALNVKCCAVRVKGELVGSELTKRHFRADVNTDKADVEFLGDLETIGQRLAMQPEMQVVDGDHPQADSPFAHAAVPLIHQGGLVGFLLARTNDAARVWADNELMLLRTVADQLTVAVNQARMFAQMQQLALTDELTGCFNRRWFEMQFERDLLMANRMHNPLSLIILDLDNFKEINDGAGHETGDLALRLLADSVRANLRVVDTAVRFGGDEFVVILPQADIQGALIVAERLRSRVGQIEVPGIGRLSASLGLATFPVHGSSRNTLILAADRALYSSKALGRNRVSTPPDDFLSTSARSAGPQLDTAPTADLIQKV
ncbi:MAG: sensor domain-containing diguanylate cyclase [Pyrinomonadaceae bacterium]|nr:sensor domain-containing diguanylate cyclase [Pyrinomonadaceae bacterium]